MKLEVIIKLPNAWTGAVGTFGVHVYEGRLTTADMDHMDAVGEKWRRVHPGKSVELNIVHPSKVRLTEEERDRLIRLVRRWEHQRTATATVILASGLLGAMQRSVLTGVMLLAPAPHPAKVFGDIPPAVAWLEPHIRALLGEDTTNDDVLAAVMDLCAAFRARNA